jgi:hypothetical protein
MLSFGFVFSELSGLTILFMERAMGIEQIQSAKTKRYCPLSSIGVKWSQSAFPRQLGASLS